MHLAAMRPVLFHAVWNFLTILKITCKAENLFPFYSWQRRTRPAYRHRWEDYSEPVSGPVGSLVLPSLAFPV